MASPTRACPEPHPLPLPRRPVRYTNTAIPKFDRTVSWNQHQQVFNAIKTSNGWDEETAALQLSDYNSPGRLAIYRSYPIVSRGFGEPSTVCGSLPGILENPVVKPIVPVATARPVPLEEPTILEVLAQHILNQTGMGGGKGVPDDDFHWSTLRGRRRWSRMADMFRDSVEQHDNSEYGKWDRHFREAPGY